MPKLPTLKSREVLSILFANGFVKLRVSGSHVRLRKGNRYVTVAYHNKTLPKGTLNSIIKQSGISREDFK